MASPSPSHPRQLQSLSPSPPWSHPEEQLHCSMEGLKLQHKNWVWQQDTSPQKEEKPRKEVQFEADEELGAETDMPAELVHFLAEEVLTPPKTPSTALPWQEEHGPNIPAAASSSQSHLKSQTRTRRERPDPVRHPNPWIINELSQSSNSHPYCWREIKASGKLNMGACIVQEGYDKYSIKHYAL